jgi:metacaspase-1
MALKALLVGVNTYPASPLKGCVNDVQALKGLLDQRYGLGDESVRMLLDTAATQEAIVTGLAWLGRVEDGENAPVRLFHFSGHGTFIADQNGDEPDGIDECLVPYDYATAGPMTDDALRAIYDSFAQDTHLLLIMDCCHSGTVERRVAEDIRYRFIPASYDERQRIKAAERRVRERRDAFAIEQINALRGEAIDQDDLARRVRELMAQFDKKHFGQAELDGNVVLISACRSDQTAADARFGEGYQGALTYYLLDTLRKTGESVIYKELIEQLGRVLYESSFLQEPQLECSAANRDRLFLAAAT